MKPNAPSSHLRHFENEKRSQPFAHHCREFRSDSGISRNLSGKRQMNLLAQKSRPDASCNLRILPCLLESLTIDFLQRTQLGQAMRKKKKKSAPFSYDIKLPCCENRFSMWLLIISNPNYFPILIR